MPISYTANQLVAMSAVIARAATSRNWNGPAGVADRGDAVQEVQCMVLKGKLYIAGNNAEHQSVEAYLSAFGVRDDATLKDCLRYSHWLLSMKRHLRSAQAGNAFTPEFSDQEDAALGMAIPLPFGTVSEEEAAVARALIDGSRPEPTESERRLGWFLRKLTGSAKGGSTAAAKYAKATNAKLTGVTSSIQEGEINIVKSIEPIHAEIKLLAFLTHCLVTFQVVAEPGVTLGGLKKTCKFCKGWIGHFQAWLTRQYKLTIHLPASDDRTEGGGAGKRPQDAATDVYGEVMKLLFNGLDNSLCADVADKRTAEGW